METPLTIYGLSKRTGMTPNYIFYCCERKPENIPKFFILHNLHRFKVSDVEEWEREQNKVLDKTPIT